MSIGISSTNQKAKGRLAQGWILILIGFALGLWACRSDQKKGITVEAERTVCAVFAHPDDETMVSGTLAKLTAKGLDLNVIYVTSGDDGPDHTGQGLYGKALGEVREQEAMQALRAIGVEGPPVFLRYPDGHVQEHLDSIQDELDQLFRLLSPAVVISFGPDGITGSPDHIYTGFASDRAFERSASGILVLHMAITKPLPPFYAHGVAVPRKSVDVLVKVSKYRKQRAEAVAAHRTQFNDRVRSSYKFLLPTMRTEKFIVAANRGGEEWLDRNF